MTEEAPVRAQPCERVDLKDPVPQRKSTLNENQSLLQKNVNKKDPPSGPGHSDKRNLLKEENGVSRRDRSASPKKSANRYSEEHLEKMPSPLKDDPKGRPRDRSLSPRKGGNKSQINTRASSGQDHCRKSRGRSSSPKKQQKIEGGKDPSSAEARFFEGESRRATGCTSDNAEELSDGKEKPGAIRKDLKQSQLGKNKTRSPEKKSKKMEEKSLPPKKTTSIASRAISESEKGKKTNSRETSSSKDKTEENGQLTEKKLRQEPEERMASNKTEDHKGKELKPESSPPVKKTITPGPWKVPSANKVPGTTGMAEKQL
jgi:hypothetical protein